MTEKQELIQKMLVMQKKFMAYEKENGVSQVEYYAPEPGHVLENYKEEYSRMASRVLELAHQEQGSKQ